jgi:hypothetical protein
MRPLPKRGQLYLINGVHVLMVGDSQTMFCYAARAKCSPAMQRTMPQWSAGFISLERFQDANRVKRLA